MMLHRVAPRVTSFLLLAIPVLVLMACKDGDQSRTRPAEITLPDTGSPALFAQIESDLAQFGLGKEHELSTKECPACRAPTAISIRSIGRTKDIKGDNGPTKFRIVALIKNRSKEDVDLTPPTGKMFTFKANTNYLMWAHSRGDKKAIWGFVELGSGYDPHPKEIGLLKNCNGAISKKDDAYFANCGEVHPASLWIKTAYAAPAMGAASIIKPGWVACDPDCCTGTSLIQ